MKTILPIGAYSRKQMRGSSSYLAPKPACEFEHRAMEIDNKHSNTLSYFILTWYNVYRDHGRCLYLLDLIRKKVVGINEI